MNKPKIIRQKLTFKPNLVDYEQAAKNFSWQAAKKELTWFPDGKINAAYNAVDRHLAGPARHKVALFWHSAKDEKQQYTFEQLAILSNKFANLLKDLAVERGDRVFFFLPRIPALYYGFLGTLKTGAIAGTLFSAFGPQALLDRLNDCDAKILVTNQELAARVAKIRPQLPYLKKVILIDAEFEKALAQASPVFKTVAMDPDEPAFMLYTSGTTGKPKGVVHSHLAILHEHLTAKWVLDIQPNDLYWCTADPGWVTGIAYTILGSWSVGATSLVFEGRFDPEVWYRLIQEYRVNVWYTAPTAIRMLSAAGDQLTKKYDFTSLRHLASVGEPLNPEAVFWGQRRLKLLFHDNWWQTETGGILIANYPVLPIKPGSMGKPFPGVTAAIVNDQGQILPPNKIGSLAIKPGWPSMMIKIWHRPKKYRKYFKHGWYISGDLAYRDKDGYFWFVSRDDDVIKTAGERVGPFEVESALMAHPAVVEAGVIGKPDPLRGQIIKAFVTLKQGEKPSEALKERIKAFVKKELAGHAYPREIEFMDHLPKTRSGKIVRRMLKAKELGLPVGDTSSLEK